MPTSIEPVPYGEPGLRFSQSDSRVLIPRRNGDAWGSMRWLHIDVVARLSEPGGTLIDADQSFGVRLRNRLIVMDLAGETDGLAEVPLDVWFHFSFTRWGLNRVGWNLRPLNPEGGAFEGAGSGIASVEVPGVGTRGVAIGNSARGPNDPLNGDVALIRIARFDPRSMSNGFLARPIDVGLANCWAEFLKKLKEALKTEVNCAEWLGGLIPQLEQDFLQRLAQLSDEKIAEFRAMTGQYRELWNAGKVGNPEMLALMARLRDWLKAEGLLALDDPGLLETFDHPCLEKLVGLLPSLDCDPDAQALLSAILGVSKPN